VPPFTILSGIAAPLPLDDVDTDKIIPARFMKTVRRDGLRAGLFYALAHDAEGRRDPAFVLNRPPFDRASLLVVGRNFGCGSSREHAVWAMVDFGIRCVIAPSFADIFYQNAIKNGVLPAVVDRHDWTRLAHAAAQPKGCVLTVDLARQTIAQEDVQTTPFEIAANHKRVLLNGLDEIAQTLAHLAEIEVWEVRAAQLAARTTGTRTI